MRPRTLKLNSVSRKLTEYLTTGTSYTTVARVRATACVDDNGNLYELLVESATSNRYLKIVRTTPTGSRSYSIRSVTSTNAMIGVIFAIENTIHVIYRSPSESTTIVYYFTFSGASALGNGAFTALPSYLSRDANIPALTGNTMTNVGALDVWVAPNTDIHLVTLIGNGTTNYIYYTKSTDDGASFSAWETAATGVPAYSATLTASVCVAVSTTDKPYVSIKYDTSTSWYIRWKDTTSWAVAKTLTVNSTAIGNIIEETLAAGDGGNMMLGYWNSAGEDLNVNIFSGTGAGTTTTFTGFDLGVTTGDRLSLIITPRQVKFVNIQDSTITTALVSIVCYNLYDNTFSPIIADKITVAIFTVTNFHSMIRSLKNEIVRFSNRADATVSRTDVELIIS